MAKEKVVKIINRNEQKNFLKIFLIFTKNRFLHTIYFDHCCPCFLKEYFFTIEGEIRIRSNILCMDLSTFCFLFTCLFTFSVYWHEEG